VRRKVQQPAHLQRQKHRGQSQVLRKAEGNVVVRRVFCVHFYLVLVLVLVLLFFPSFFFFFFFFLSFPSFFYTFPLCNSIPLSFFLYSMDATARRLILSGKGGRDEEGGKRKGEGWQGD
jgi:hypothetical protein